MSITRFSRTITAMSSGSTTRRVTLVFGMLALGLVSAIGTAQQKFTLGDDDTWQALETADPGSAAGQLAAARRALAEGDHGYAADLASTWIDEHDTHELLPEAYLTRGDALKGQREYYEALFDYEYIARAFPASEAFPIALSRELEIARMFATGTRRKWLGMRVVDASDEAEELLIRIQERMPGSRLAEEAGISLGDFYFERRDMALAVDAYDLFLENYPKSAYVRKARWRLVYAHLATFKGPEFDPAGLSEAEAWLQRIKLIEPAAEEQADALLVRIDESAAQKLLESAAWYERRGDPISAEFNIRRLVQEHPASIAATQALRDLPRLMNDLPPHVRDEAKAAAVYPPNVFESADLAAANVMEQNP